MARAGKCPVCERQRVLERFRIFVNGDLWYVFICQECIEKIVKKKVEPF